MIGVSVAGNSVWSWNELLDDCGAGLGWCVDACDREEVWFLDNDVLQNLGDQALVARQLLADLCNEHFEALMAEQTRGFLLVERQGW